MQSKYFDKKFFPYYFFEVMVVALIAVEAALILAALFPPAVGREIDFQAPYSPRPEWYFLFLYELTKYFPGRWTFIGAALIPGLAYALLLLTPFMDDGREISLKKRKIMAGICFGLLLCVIALTVKALL